MNSSATASNGHWVTINGAKVYIEDGKVTKGPSHLIGGEVEGHRFRKATADDVVAQKRKDAEHRLPPPGETPEWTATHKFTDRHERQTRKSHEQEPFHLVDMPVDLLTAGNKIFPNRMERQNAIGGSSDPGFVTISHNMHDGTPVYNVDDGNHRVEHARRSGKKTVPMYVQAYEPEHLDQLKADVNAWHAMRSPAAPEKTMTLSASQILSIRQRARSFGRAVAPCGGELGTIGDMQINLSNDQHVPAGSPQGGQFASKGTVNERDVSKLMKDIRGVQATTQKRATHNEVAPNGETYRGGAFIATTELPKRIRQKLEQYATGKVRTATGFAVPEPGQMSIVDKLGGTVMNPRNGEINYQYMEYIGASADQVKRYESLAAKHMAGEQWVSVNDYPEIASIVDAARLFVAGKPIPSAVLDKFKGNEAAERLKKYQQDKGMNLSASMNLDRGTQGDEGHFVTIDHHVVFIKDDTGSGANGKGGKFTKHGLEKKLMKHHESRGGFATHEHRDALAQDSGGDLMGRSRFTFHNSLPGEVRRHIENNPAARKLFRVSSNAADAKGADALASLGDRYFDMADEAAGGHMTQALAAAEKSDDPEARFHAAIYKELPKTKTAQGVLTADKLAKLREGNTFTINGRKMTVTNEEGTLMLDGGTGFPSVPVDALSESPIDKNSFKAGTRKKEVVPFSAAIELSRKELTGGRWVTIHPHNGEDYKRLYIGGDGTIKAGPKAMVGKHIDGTKATHEVREADHPQSPLKVKTGGTFTAQTVDPNKQLGMFAKDKDGNHQEVGERAGQGALFHDTAKAKPVVDQAQAKRDEDAKATGEMFPAKKPEDATDRREKMIRDAQALRYLAVKMMPDDMPTRAQLRVSDATTKGDIDKFIMQKYGVDADVARDASNQGLTERGTHKIDGSKVTWTGGGDEPTEKTHPDVAKHVKSIIAAASAKPETTSAPSDKIGRDTTPVAATKDGGQKLGEMPTPAFRTAGQAIKAGEMRARGVSGQVSGQKSGSVHPEIAAARERTAKKIAEHEASIASMDARGKEIADDPKHDAKTKKEVADAVAQHRLVVGEKIESAKHDLAQFEDGRPQREAIRAQHAEKWIELNKAWDAGGVVVAHSFVKPRIFPPASRSQLRLGSSGHIEIQRGQKWEHAGNLEQLFPATKPTAADTIAKMKSDDVPDSNDLDGSAMRDLKAKSMERVKAKTSTNPVQPLPQAGNADKGQAPSGKAGKSPSASFSPGDSHSVHPNLIEYATRELFKGKSVSSASKAVATKFDGATNMFLGGKVNVTPAELEHAIYDNKAKGFVESMASVRPGNEEAFAAGDAKRFNLDPKKFAKYVNHASGGKYNITGSVNLSASSVQWESMHRVGYFGNNVSTLQPSAAAMR